MKKISINWFRKDLRLNDNPSLNFLSKKKLPVLNLFIIDSDNQKPIGSASKVWLHHSLKDLNEQLENNLLILQNEAQIVFERILKYFDVKFISWNRCYEPWRIKRDKNLKVFLKQKGISVNTFNASLLWEPWNILKKDLTPYKVYSPFYKRGCLNFQSPRLPEKTSSFEILNFKDTIQSDQHFNLLPKVGWHKKIIKDWDISKKGMEKKKSYFFNNSLSSYKDGRNFPSLKSVSELSPFIQWGQISVNELWYRCQSHLNDEKIKDNAEHFMSELGWREFSYYLLYHFPSINTQNFQKKFDNFPWIENKEFLKRWQMGITGYPIVDAGMRELRLTGYMHNRVRMIVGSFLVKNLLIDWRKGEEWFWDNLFDADLANNSAGWQWVAGSGADAAPYFRIFNPVSQGQKFDKDGTYTKRFVPELLKLDPKFLFCPWEASNDVLKKANISLGVDYPRPIVDIKVSREKALKSFSSIKI